jgi:hypothetical protein
VLAAKSWVLRLDRVRNEEIRQRFANAELLQTVLRRSRLRWLGHVARVRPERVPQQVPSRLMLLH